MSAEPPPLGDNGMDKPFEDFPRTETSAYQDSVACGGLSVAAATLEVEGYERAVLIFHFQRGDGQAAQPHVLVLEDKQMLAVADLMGKAARRAVQVARQTRLDKGQRYGR